MRYSPNAAALVEYWKQRAANQVIVSAPELMRSVTLRVKGARLAAWRLKIATPFFRLAAIIAGIGVSIENE